MASLHLESNPLFPQTTIFIGNGFDLSLGLKTKYTDFFNHKDGNGKKDFWPRHEINSDEDQLYRALNGSGSSFDNSHKLGLDSTWSDLEEELKKHAKRLSHRGIEDVTNYENSFLPDQEYYNEIKLGLLKYLTHEVEDWSKNRHCDALKSPAYQLMYEICARVNSDPHIITFNYTNIISLLKKCEGNCTDDIQLKYNKIQQVHGSLLEKHIILGINEDKDVPKEYDFLFKSWDEYYCSHQIIDTLRNSQIIFFFGLSFGSIDSVYFVDFFKSIINGSYDKNKKHIVICTLNEKSMREIYRNFFQMGISIMELKAHCDFNILLTNPDTPHHNLKFESNKIENWLRKWNDITIDVS